MERNQFEKELKNKMDTREIMPSDKAWDRLDAMLTVAEQKKPKRHFNWLFIAAGIAGFLFIGTIFMSQIEEATDKGTTNPIVFEQLTQPAQNAQEQTIAPAVDSEAIASTETPVQTKSKYNHQPSVSELAKQSKSNQSINPVEAVNPIPDNQGLIASNHQSSIITRAKGEQAGGNQKTEQPVTAAKVDELLASVAQNPGGNPKTSVRVNAKNLLSEVDQQVNRSFREKMLRRAGEVAEAVVNRNND